MLVSYTISVEPFYNYSMNVIISLEPIPCLNYVTIFYKYEWKILQKLQHLTEVDQEMVAINDQQIPIYVPF